MAGPTKEDLQNNPNVPVIEEVARQKGVPPAVALADAWQESNWSNTSLGDQGTSVGLFQLHEGGEYPSSQPFPSWGENPVNNATTALTEFQQVATEDPALRNNPGAWAKAAERPSDPTYIDSVNAAYNDLVALGVPGTGSAVAGGSDAATGTGGVEDAGWLQTLEGIGKSLLGVGGGVAGDAGGLLSGLLVFPDQIVKFFSTATAVFSDLLTVVEFLINPLSWLRLGIGFLGLIALAVGGWLIIGELKAG